MDRGTIPGTVLDLDLFISAGSCSSRDSFEQVLHHLSSQGTTPLTRIQAICNGELWFEELGAFMLKVELIVHDSEQLQQLLNTLTSAASGGGGPRRTLRPHRLFCAAAMDDLRRPALELFSDYCSRPKIVLGHSKWRLVFDDVSDALLHPSDVRVCEGGHRQSV